MHEIHLCLQNEGEYRLILLVQMYIIYWHRCSVIAFTTHQVVCINNINFQRKSVIVSTSVTVWQKYIKQLSSLICSVILMLVRQTAAAKMKLSCILSSFCSLSVPSFLSTCLYTLHPSNQEELLTALKMTVLKTIKNITILYVNHRDSVIKPAQAVDVWTILGWKTPFMQLILQKAGSNTGNENHSSYGWQS